jgi:hypothetical protein
MKDKLCLYRDANKILIFFEIILLLIMHSYFNQVDASALPQGVSIIYGTTENFTMQPADSHTAAGGSFTTLTLNVTSQTSKWKAYVGNVTGKLTLDNSNNKTIYDWALTAVQGEVYVSRNDSVNFTSMVCANTTQINSEETILGINSSSSDSINTTFQQKSHKSFVIGGTGLVANSTCYSIATYINDASQASSENAVFQEVVMSDRTSLVFVTILEDGRLGFDSGTYDFQIIVPDNPTEVSNAYYFYAELG